MKLCFCTSVESEECALGRTEAQNEMNTVTLLHTVCTADTHSISLSFLTESVIIIRFGQLMHTSVSSGSINVHNMA